MKIKPNKCECCGKKEHRLFLDHEINKWVCNVCWEKTHDIYAVKANWNALGIAS